MVIFCYVFKIDNSTGVGGSRVSVQLRSGSRVSHGTRPTPRIREHQGKRERDNKREKVRDMELEIWRGREILMLKKVELNT